MPQPKPDMVETTMDPNVVALELLTRAKGNHRAAEVEGWKLRDAHGRDTVEGRVLAAAAFIIADMYHDNGKGKPKDPDFANANVPLFTRQG
jgi:hypothetical protein